MSKAIVEYIVDVCKLFIKMALILACSAFLMWMVNFTANQFKTPVWAICGALVIVCAGWELVQRIYMATKIWWRFRK